MQLLHFFIILFIPQPVVTRFGWNVYQNLEKYRDTYLPSRFCPKPVLTSPKTAVFSGLSLKNRKDQDHGPGKTGPGPDRSIGPGPDRSIGPGPDRSIGPTWSFGPDL